ncbi:MAG: hypothetical protein CV090_13240 [Nitrospira sp. WS238]|nr:hypothetical protein [Nitrospira sp. WS238]
MMVQSGVIRRADFNLPTTIQGRFQVLHEMNHDLKNESRWGQGWLSQIVFGRWSQAAVSKRVRTR